MQCMALEWGIYLPQHITTQHNNFHRYPIHWPNPSKHVAAYKKIQELQTAGKIKGIGVSSYAWEDYLKLKDDPEITQLLLVN